MSTPGGQVQVHTMTTACVNTGQPSNMGRMFGLAPADLQT